MEREGNSTGVGYPEMSKNMEEQMQFKETSYPLERETLVPRFFKVISSTVAEINPLLDQFIDVVKNLPCAPENEDDIRLAVYEALVNAIAHGNENDPARKVAVACFCECRDAENLLVVIRDEGSGFHPDTVPDPRSEEMLYASHGRGIFLMRQLMDEVSYVNGGREVQMRKRSTHRCQ